MKYECLLKIKYSYCGQFETKYRCVVDDYVPTVKRYKAIGSNYVDHVVLVNKFDDDGVFVETVL